MQPVHHPDTIRLIHEARVNDEMARSGTRPRRETDQPGPRPGDGIRSAIGRALIAIGTRIEPTRERQQRPVPAPR